MQRLQHKLAYVAQDAPLLSDARGTLTKAQLLERVAQVTSTPLAFPRSVGILSDNCVDWLVVDLACQIMGVTLVPLPSFFTPQQLTHVITTSHIRALWVQNPQHACRLGFDEVVPLRQAQLGLFLMKPSRDPAWTPSPPPVSTITEGFEPARNGQKVQSVQTVQNVQKVTFTSGTTADPKGVCLSAQQQWQVAHSLHQVLADANLHIKKHLTLLPFPVLLENIAGAYTALLAGAENIVLPLSDVGLTGATQFDPNRCLAAIAHYQIESVIVLPQMLQALVACTQAHDPRIASLKWVAVGGAKVPIPLLQAARDKGFPVYEGYGLSECASVVSLNLPQAQKIGSVGKPLPHHHIRVADDGEILVKAHAPVRYLGQSLSNNAWVATGDLGHMDADGYLHVSGRKKNVLITSFGRNISPEWPEAALLGTHLFAQVVVLGDGQPFLSALLVLAGASAAIAPPTNTPTNTPTNIPTNAPQNTKTNTPINTLTHAPINSDCIEQAIAAVNQTLPDYARIGAYAVLTEPMSVANGLATANGRPKREAIQERFALSTAFFKPLKTTETP